MATQVSFNRAKFEALLGEALKDLNEKAEVAFQDAIKSWEYNWPRSTERKVGVYSGEFVSAGPRDIVDTGNLLYSYDLKYEDPLTSQWSWDPIDPDSGERYALVNHEGDGAGEWPARPWTKVAMRELKPLQAFEDSCRRVFR